MWIASLALFLLASTDAGTPDVKEIVAQISAKEIEQTIKDLVSFENRNTNGETQAKKADRGITGARIYLRKKLEGYAAQSGGRLKVYEDWFLAEGRRITRPLKVANVVAELPGTTDPERIYLVGGHYDSINSDRFDTEGPAPGANDDASGTAVTVELARVLSRYQFPATLRFVCFAGEEQGLLGSKHHAAQLQEAGAFIDGMITNDIVGNSKGGNGKIDDRTIRVFSASKEGSDSPSRQFARLVHELTQRYVSDVRILMVFRRDRFGRGGDHIPFDAAGWPGLRFSEPFENYRLQHQDVRIEEGVEYGDQLKFVDFAYTTKVARVNAAVLSSLALAPRPPAKVQVQGVMRYDTLLRWTPVKGEDVAGYEVVWRDTTQPNWTDSLGVGKVMQTIMPILLDTHIVGVRTVGKNGHKSRVVVPPGM